MIGERLKTLPEGSYTAKLAKEGIERIAQKFGEESVETLIAMVKKDKDQVVYESADML